MIDISVFLDILAGLVTGCEGGGKTILITMVECPVVCLLTTIGWWGGEEAGYWKLFLLWHQVLASVDQCQQGRPGLSLPVLAASWEGHDTLGPQGETELGYYV